MYDNTIVGSMKKFMENDRIENMLTKVFYTEY